MQRSAVLLALLLLATPATQELDRSALDRIEDLSESLANDLLALSVSTRDLDERGIAAHFAQQVEFVGRPRLETEPVQEGEGLWRSDWVVGSEREILDRGAAAAWVGELLARFDSVDDARFKVKQARFDEQGVGQAHVKSYLIGRNRAGQREWLVSWAQVAARQVGEEAWEMHAFEVESMTSLVSERDLFAEVALPAGVGARFPDFGVPPNETVVAHGPAVADVDGDGLLDVLATGVERNLLYRNLGDGRFEDVSEETLISLSRPGTGALWFDADADGDQDLFLAAVGTQMYLENRLVPDGELRFLDVSSEAGVDREAIGFSVAGADVNGDGRTDIYVAGYNRYGLVMPDNWWQASNGTPNLLFLNEGEGRFREAAAEWGVRDTRWSYAAAFADIDGDGDQDLYVANDFGENALYSNEGNAGFVDVAAERGVLDPGNGMGVAFGDYDNDGALDLHVTNMSSTAGNRILGRLFPDSGADSSLLRKLAAGNSIYRGDGAGGFVDVTQTLGGFSAGWAWGGGFIDVDNDGWEDVYSPNGFISGKTMNDT